MSLREQIEELFARGGEFTTSDREVFESFKQALNRGEVRAAERDPSGAWRVNSWVKRGILAGFRMGALVGSCAQIGKRVHLSAAAQIGGVLEPVGAVPVVIEDDVLVGGNCGVYEGTIVRAGAVLAPGTILTGATPVYDLVRGEVYRRTEGAPLEIPSGAVVVPGSRAVATERGREWGLSLYTPVIVKYRDEKTERAVQLEDYLR